MNDQKVLPFRARLERDGVDPVRNDRKGWLTRYELESLYSDALWAGRGARLEVAVPARASDDNLAGIRSRLDRLRNRGVGVRVLRDSEWHYRDWSQRRA